MTLPPHTGISIQGRFQIQKKSGVRGTILISLRSFTALTVLY